jgi:hypothetical protein
MADSPSSQKDLKAPKALTIPLFNNATGQQEYVPQEQAGSLVKSGSYGMPTDQPQYFRYADGEIMRVRKANDLVSALDSGAHAVTEAEAFRDKRAKSGLGQAVAGLTGAASGATFGLSDLAARGVQEATGLNVAEEIRAAKEANPTTAAVGNVLGTIGSSLALPGGGLVGAASKLGAGVAERAGAAIGADVAKGVLASAVKKGTTAAAGSAVEGALFGTGQTLSEQSLGDPRSLGESLVANVGLGSMLGGMVGGGLTAGGQLLQPAIGAVGKGFVQASGKLRKFEDADIAVQKSIFDKTNPVREYLTDNKKFQSAVEDNVHAILTDAAEHGQGASRALNEAIASTKVDARVGRQAINATRDQIDTLLTLAPHDTHSFPPQVVRELDGLKQMLTPLSQDEAAAVSEQIALRQQRLASAKLTDAQKEGVENQIRDYQTVLNRGSPENALEVLREVKRKTFELGNLSQSASLMDPTQARAAKVFKGLNDTLKTSVWDSEAFGPIAQHLSAFDEAAATRFNAMNQLKELGVLKKQGQSYVLQKNGINSIVRQGGEGADALEALMQADAKVQAAHAGLLAGAGKEGVEGAVAGTGAISSSVNDLPNILRQKMAVQGLFRNESMTGRSLIGSVGGYALGGPAGAALALGLENPGYITQRLAGMFESAGQLSGKSITGSLLSTANAATTTQIIDKLNQATQAEVDKYAQMRQLEEAQNNVQKTIQASFSNGLSSAANAKSVDIPKSSFTISPKDFTAIRTSLESGESPFAAQVQQSYVQTPQAAAAAQETLKVAQNFLKQKLPNAVLDDLGQPVPPGPVALAKFAKYAEAVSNPMVVLENLNKGYVSPEGLDTLRTVYPQMWAAVQEQAKNSVTDKAMSARQKQFLAQVISGGSKSQQAIGQSAQAAWVGINAKNAANPMSEASASAQSALGAQGIHVKPFDVTASKAPERRGSSV